MSSFLTLAIDAQVRVELVRDLFKLEGLEPVPEDVALALEDDEHAPDSARVNGTGPRPRPGAAMPCSLMDAVLSKGCYSL